MDGPPPGPAAQKGSKPGSSKEAKQGVQKVSKPGAPQQGQHARDEPIGVEGADVGLLGELVARSALGVGEDGRVQGGLGPAGELGVGHRQRGPDATESVEIDLELEVSEIGHAMILCS